MEQDLDRRRLRTSFLISLVLWAILMPLLSFLKIKGPAAPIDSMNPMYVELAPEPEPPVKKSPASASIAEADRSGASAAPAPREEKTAPSAAQAAAPKASSERPAAAPAAPVRLAADPSNAPLPTASRDRSAQPYQAGAESLTPLSEEGLQGEAPPAPVPRPAPAARATATATASSEQTDTFDRALQSTSERLASGPASSSATSSSGSATSTSSAGKSSGTASSASAGSADLSGAFDFGDGATRELWSSRRIRVPDKLLAGKPNDLSTRVSFTIEGGGTVLPGTIRFDPPLPQDLESFLRTVFSSWLFSPADSDGQVVFRYSIKVR